MSLDRLLYTLLKDINTLAIVDDQWGDTGKGKFVELLTSNWADIIIRGTGGANAGHTILIGEDEFIFHLLPSGILHDSEGKINIIGNGVAFDPRAIKKELGFLNEHSLSYENLKIAYNAKLLLPYHIIIDRLGEKIIGTTGRGIGPVYVAHVDRKGLIVNDILNPNILKEKLEKILLYETNLLKCIDINSEEINKVLQEVYGEVFNANNFLDIDTIVEVYSEYGEFFKKMIMDTDELVRKSRGEKKILLEGAQGLLLSRDFGTYPYVTSSDSSIYGLSKGAGLHKDQIDLVLSIVKAFYMTRVGMGPFPTEIGGKESEGWCEQVHTMEEERRLHPDATVNSKNPFKQGVGIRFAGREYGTTTGRPRRVGWLDLVLLKHAVRINGDDIILTKLDVLDECKEIKICTAYEYRGPDLYFGNQLIKKGTILKEAIPYAEVLYNCQPVYKQFEGWGTKTTQITSYEALPQNMREIITYIQEETGVKIRMISVGPDRSQTIVI